MLPRILFDTAGGRHSEYSTGHLSRCLQVCDRIRAENPEARFRFAIPQDPSGISILRKAGYEPVFYRGKNNQKKVIGRIFREWNPDIVVIDRLDCPEEHVRWLKQFGKIVIIADDSTAATSLADISINSLIPNKRSQYPGYAYLLLSGSNSKKAPFSQEAKHCLISFGGYEPGKLTVKLLKALAQEVWAKRIHFHVFAGIGPSNRVSLKRLLKKFGKYSRLYPYSQKFFDVMTKVDTVITGGGLTMFEASKRGNVTGIFELREHQRYNIRTMARKSLIFPLGDWKTAEKRNSLKRLRALFEEAALRKHLHKHSDDFWKKIGSETTYERLLQVVTIDPKNKRRAKLWAKKPTQAVLDYAMRYCEHRKLQPGGKIS